ncbi:hypothetical protein PBRA_008240 [Plasmodiophora brassicae]|uniref:Uncharacterized protein n=1 Tax=Plasmodiophora brassicae TaxID=37360 RepID=A0A0G4IZX5_PLABS|nr:hypothetical protein PBRA_008240 [Plasmodiophora brassicae]
MPGNFDDDSFPSVVPSDDGQIPGPPLQAVARLLVTHRRFGLDDDDKCNDEHYKDANVTSDRIAARGGGSVVVRRAVAPNYKYNPNTAVRCLSARPTPASIRVMGHGESAA